MTGYGRGELSRSGLSVRVEIRSLNGKYTDIDVKLPRYLYELESEIRSIISKELERGSIICTIALDLSHLSGNLAEVKINKPLAEAYFRELSALAEDMKLPFHEPFNQILRLPDILSNPETKLEQDHKDLILETVAVAVAKLQEFRTKEGLATQELLYHAVDLIEQQLEIVESEETHRKKALRTKLESALQEVPRDKIDLNRFEQELLMYLEKWDIAEEKNRLKQHLNYFRSCLEKEPFGRKLNFISQEMGREMNTMGVKSNHFPMQQAVVLMKEKLEQIKEQVLNLV